MTPGEIGQDLRAKGFVPEPWQEDEPREYWESIGGQLYGRALGRHYFEELI